MLHRVLVVVPAYNAANTISILVDQLEKLYPHIAILVVDDGSTDGTDEVVRVHGATVINHDRNIGKGRALRTAFDFALENEFDAVVTMDADLQHDPAEVQLFLEEFIDDTTILLGVRRLGPEMPLARKISNTLSTFVTSVFAGVRVHDSQCGFRLIPTRVLRSLNLVSRYYELEPELIIRAARAGYRFRDIPIKTIYNNSSSSIRPASDTLRFLKLLAKSLFW